MPNASDDLPGAGDAGEHDQRVARDVDVDVLEVVLAGPADVDEAVGAFLCAAAVTIVRRTRSLAHAGIRPGLGMSPLLHRRKVLRTNNLRQLPKNCAEEPRRHNDTKKATKDETNRLSLGGFLRVLRVFVVLP